MTTTIYLVRHGHVHNPRKVFYGRLPGFQLSPQGREEAQKMGNHFRTKKLAALYASPLERTQETASFIQAHHPHLSIQIEERFTEVGAPAKDGTPFGDSNPLEWNFYTEEHIGKGGERMEAIWERMHSGLVNVAKKHVGEEIAIVSHGDPIMITKTMLQNKPLAFEHIRGKNYIQTAQGIVLEFDGSTLHFVRPAVY